MQGQRPRAFIATVAALAVGGATTAGSRASAAIFDIDDRIGVAPGDDWLRAVGVASETPTSNYGTAFLIGACHALSARHVVHRAEVIGQRLKLQFEPWRAATPANSSSGTVVAAGGAASGASDLSQDWILLRLDRCLGETLGFLTPSNRPLRLGVAQEGAGQWAITPGLQAVGFPNDRTIERGPTVDPACRVRLITSFGLLHDCATLPGNSGGPLIAWNEATARYEVYAINVAGHDRLAAERFDAKAANVAVSMAAILPAISAQIERDRHAAPKRNSPHPRSWIEGSSSSR